MARAYSSARIVLAIALLAGSLGLAWLHLAFNAQRIHIRYVPQVSGEVRVFLERHAGLADGELIEPRTWSYLLKKRSRSEIQTLISNPLVEQTGHIDRSQFRVIFDRPELPSFLRELASAGWLPWGAIALGLCGSVGLLAFRHDVSRACGRAYDWLRDTAAAIRTRPDTFKRRLTLIIVGATTALALPMGVEARPDEISFIHLYEAISILAGDHPYRDFFEWGAPLPAYLSAGAQWLVGYRIIGELLLQWTLTLAGVVVAFHLGLRQLKSSSRVLLVLPLTVFVLVASSGYHFSKYFSIPLAIWFGWRYLDHPSPRRSAALGGITAVAFLFRHDYGLWAGISSIVAIVLLRIVKPESRTVGSVARDCAAYALTAAVAVLPWAVAVATNEGLASYVAARGERFTYSRNSGTQNSYTALLEIHPVRQLRPAVLPAPESRTVSFEWEADVDDSRRQALETQYELQPLTTDESGSLRYKVANAYDVRLLGLRDAIRNEKGFSWQLLDDAQRGRPSREGTYMWLAQMTMLVPVVLIISGLLDLYRGWLDESIRTLCAQRVLAGVVLVCVCWALIRDWSYFATVAPAVAALSARFLERRHDVQVHAAPSLAGAIVQAWRGLSVILTIVLLALTTYAAFVLRPPILRESPFDAARQIHGRILEWITPDSDGHNGLSTYLRACTASTDRLLLTGSGPYYVPYYTHRPMAGGHVDWSVGFRSDPARENQSLMLLKKQSVPFVVGRRAHVIGEFSRYPRVRAYLAENYAEVEGTAGSILYDTRRQLVRNVGPDHRPCFR